MKYRKALVCIMVLLILMFASACGGNTVADINSLYDEMAHTFNLNDMIDVTQIEAQNYYDINCDEYNQFLMKVSENGLCVNEIWMFEAKNTNDANSLSELARSRVEHICEETQYYLPDQYEVAAHAEIVKKGSYVALFITPDSSSMSEMFLKAVS